MINTAPATFRSGTLQFSIDSTNVGETEIVDISTLNYEFNLKSSESIINGVAIIPGAMTLTMFDKLSTGLSAYDHLSAELSGATLEPKNIPVTMRFTPHGSTTSNTFRFQVQYPGLQYDIKTDRLTLQLLPPLQTSERYADFFANMQNVSPGPAVTNLQVRSGLGFTNYECYIAGDFITKYLRHIDPDSVSNVFYSGYNTIPVAGTIPDFPSPGFGAPMQRTGYVFANLSTPYPEYDGQPASAKVLSLAAMEGAIVGSAFSVSFYVNRMSNVLNRTLTNNDITDLRIVQRDRQVNAVNVFINALNLSFVTSGLQAVPQNATNRTAQRGGWLYGTQFVGIDLIAHAPQLGRGNTENDGTNIIANAESTQSYINTDFQNIAKAGVSAYQVALNGVVSREYQEIETTILGVSTIKPHETIRFDSTAPARVQNKHFRPSSLSYDFKSDTISITAYEII